jgi:hypothetical protein
LDAYQKTNTKRYHYTIAIEMGEARLTHFFSKEKRLALALVSLKVSAQHFQSVADTYV